MKMFARVSFLASLGFAAILGCSASVGTFEGSGGSPSGAGGAGLPGAGGADGAGGSTLPSGGAVGAGGAVVGAGGAVVGAGGAVVGAGGADVGAGGAVVGAGGADAGPGCSATSFTVSNMSYIDNGKFCGYAWTAAYEDGGATIEPPCPAAGGDCFTGTICATAVIPANEAPVYPGVMIGWNVAQKSSGGTEGTFADDFTSITPTFTTTGVTGQVRVVLQSGTGTDYCADATSGTAIPRAGFSKGCWDAATAVPLPAGTPIKTLLLQVNGSDDAAQPNAEFCLTDLKVQ